MKIEIQVFAGLKDFLPSDLSIYEQLTIAGLKEYIIQNYPQSETLLSISKIAINQKIVDDESITIHWNDTVALLPPFSGG